MAQVDAPGRRLRLPEHNATTTGTVFSVVIYATDNANYPPWSDNHDLVETAPGVWSVDLIAGASFPTTRNVDTLFDCVFHINDVVMSYAIAGFDANGAQLDCLVSGADPVGIVDGSNQGVGEPVDPLFDLVNCHL